MSQERGPAQAEQLFTTLQEIHATLRANLEQQNARIAYLEERLLPEALNDAPKSVEVLEEKRASDLDASDGDTAPEDGAQEPQFNADDFPEIMAIWPDPNQAIQTTASGTSGRTDEAEMANNTA
jgi:hypothetical protein